MAKFRYYITDLDRGCIQGTDDTDRARDLAESEDYFVVDTETGMWLQPEGETEEIAESKTSSDLD